MRIRLVLPIVLWVLSAGCASQTGHVSSRSARLEHPNIILFLVDDMGWQDTSVQFGPERTFWNDYFRTPNMQRLAERGVKFTNAYAASPVCSPTRCAILTGQHPARTGITDWVGHGISENDQLRSPEWTEQGLQPGDGNITLPQVLSDAGYLTAHVGKAHFGAINTPGEDPTNLGFDLNIGGSHAGSPRGNGEQGAYFAPFPRRFHPGLEHYPPGTYLTDALTQEAIRVIDRATADGKPFFIHLAHYAVHTPIAGQGDPRFLENYSDTLPGVERQYAAMVESMDASLGAVMDHLEEAGIADNTVIIFFSDNGGLSNHTRANTTDPDDPWARDWHNAPAFSGKGSGYDGGVRVPMIVAWADDANLSTEMQIEPGSHESMWVSAEDIFPTVLGFASVENPLDGAVRDGMNIIDVPEVLYQGTQLMVRTDRFWHYPHQWYNQPQATREAGIRPFSAVSCMGCKLIYFYSPEGGELEYYYDLGERENLAEAEKDDIWFRLAASHLLNWLEHTDAALPIDKATGETVDISNLLEAAGR